MAGKSFSVNRVGEFISGDLDVPYSEELERASASAVGFVNNTARTLFRSMGREVTLRTHIVGRKRVTKIFVEPPIDCVIKAMDACKELKSSHEAIRESFPEGAIGALSIRGRDK